MFRRTRVEGEVSAVPPHQTFAVGIILSMIAGYLEAHTYILRGGVFCNGQTSNIALMMINFVRGDFARALYYPIPILAFFFGIVFAAFLRGQLHTLRWARLEMLILLLEMGLLFVVGFVPQGGGDTPVNILVTFICAVQYEIFRETRGLPYASIFCTGNLRTAAEYFYVFASKRDRLAGATCLRYILVIGAFAVGVFAGAYLSQLWNVKSIWVCCVMFVALMPLMFRRNAN